jgi:hypothetical protein
MTEREEIEVLRWYLHAITVAFDCGCDAEVAALLANVDAHRWCEEDGFLACDQSVRRVFAGALD